MGKLLPFPAAAVRPRAARGVAPPGGACGSDPAPPWRGGTPRHTPHTPVAAAGSLFLQ